MKPAADILCERLRAILADTPVGEWRTKARAIAAACLQQLEVVSREEFDAHCKLLAATTAKIDALEKQLATTKEKRTLKKD